MQKLIAIFDKLESELARMSKADLVDTGARLSAIDGRIEKLRASIKTQLLKGQRPNKQGEYPALLGTDFQALARLTISNRIDGARLRDEQPRIAEKYSAPQETVQLSFRPRG